ncbi:MAG: alpha/beta fold hydrolase [Reyranellaceae bacterium]
MHFTVDGQRINATTGGAAIDPALPAVLFIHGAGFDRTTWRLQTRYFAHHGRSVLAVDLPGHGESEGDAIATIEEMADWVPKFLDAAGLKQAALVGHSMGAMAALQTAARHPGRVRSLALCGVAATMPVHPEMLESARAGTVKVRELMTFWGIGRTLQMGGMASPGLRLIGESLAVLGRARPGVIHTDLAACNAHKTLVEAAKSVTCPTLLVLGDGDLMTPVRNAKALGDAIAGSRTEVIEDSGHFMMVERPDETLAALKTIV